MKDSSIALCRKRKTTRCFARSALDEPRQGHSGQGADGVNDDERGQHFEGRVVDGHEKLLWVDVKKKAHRRQDVASSERMGLRGIFQRGD